MVLVGVRRREMLVGERGLGWELVRVNNGMVGAM